MVSIPFRCDQIPAITQSSFIFRKFCFACRRGWLVLSVGNSFWNVYQYHVPITNNLYAKYERKILIIISEMGFNANTMALARTDDVACIWFGPFGSHDGSMFQPIQRERTFNFAFEIRAPELICICTSGLRH